MLKNNGWAILQSPVDIDRKKTYEDFSMNTPEQRLKAFGQKDHVRIYGLDYSERLKVAGFNVTEDNFVKKFSDDEIITHVLGDFTPDEKQAITQVLPRVSEAILCLLTIGLVAAMNRYN